MRCIPKTAVHSTVRVLYMFGVCILFVSVLWSGFGYMFDIDEINHVQRAYQMTRGDIPFVSFYTIYTPFIQWVILPVLSVVGHTFDALRILRMLMIILFVLRVVFLFLLARKVFGNIPAYIWLVLYLIEPFTVFSSMQIRPDSLMMLALCVGIYMLVVSVETQRKHLMFWAGVVMCFSVLVHIKTVPTVLIMSTALLIYQVYKKNIGHFFVYCIGAFLPFVMFVLYTFFVGSFEAMVQQVVLDPLYALGSLKYPAQVGDLFRPGNYYLFASENPKPYTWFYIWMLPSTGLAGAFYALILCFEKFVVRIRVWKKFIIIGLVCSMIVQWMWLFTINSVFIQYYVPVMWLFTLFTAFAIGRVYTLVALPKHISGIVFGVCLLIFISVIWQSVRSNITRATLQENENIETIEALWHIIPEDAAVYPRLLFRPSGHPLATSQFYPELPESIKKRYPSVEHQLERDSTPYVLISFYELSQYSESLRQYIDQYYEYDARVESLYRRKTIE